MQKVSRSVRSTHNPDGAVVLDIRQGQIFLLNPVASRIFALLESEADESVILDTLSQEFEVPSQVVAGDLREFVATLETYRLLEDEGSAATIIETPIETHIAKR